jgi:hypothetical protein
LDRIWNVPKSVSTSARPLCSKATISARTFVPAASSASAAGGLGTVTIGAGVTVGSGKGVVGGSRIVDMQLFQQTVHHRDNVGGRLGVGETDQDWRLIADCFTDLYVAAYDTGEGR